MKSDQTKMAIRSKLVPSLSLYRSEGDQIKTTLRLNSDRSKIASRLMSDQSKIVIRSKLFPFLSLHRSEGDKIQTTLRLKSDQSKMAIRLQLVPPYHYTGVKEMKFRQHSD